MKRRIREENVGADLAPLFAACCYGVSASKFASTIAGGLGRACVRFIFMRRSDAKSSPTSRTERRQVVAYNLNNRADQNM